MEDPACKEVDRILLGNLLITLLTIEFAHVTPNFNRLHILHPSYIINTLPPDNSGVIWGRGILSLS